MTGTVIKPLVLRLLPTGDISQALCPARKVAKPRRLPSTRRAVADTRLVEINETAATTGNDRRWTACCRGFPSRPPAAAAAHSRSRRGTSARTSA